MNSRRSVRKLRASSRQNEAQTELPLDTTQEEIKKALDSALGASVSVQSLPRADASTDRGTASAELATSPASESPPRMPVRRLQNFAYCQRLFYLQWVEEIFVENADTVEGSAVHRQTDKPSQMPDDPREMGLPEGARVRSLTLESEALGLTGKIDVCEGTEDGIEVIDHKKGSALRGENGERTAKSYDAVQVAAYALMLREQGFKVRAASIYYVSDRRRVPVPLTDNLFATVRSLLTEARLVAESGTCPPPLNNDPRCLYCSAYPVCLPNESAFWAAPGSKAPVVQKAGCTVGQRGGEFVVSEKSEPDKKFPLHQVRAIYLYGAVQLTAQAAHACLEHGIDVSYFSPAGRFLGLLRGLPASGVDARRGQYRLFGEPGIRLKIAREVVRAKIHNQRVMLMRNGEAPEPTLRRLAELRDLTGQAGDLDTLRGIEGTAAALYFEQFATMLSKRAAVDFDFTGRNRRPPRDPLNALLSQGYSILSKELAGVCHTVGLDPFLGFYHQPRYGRPALALDLMEEFRPLVADSVAISLLNRSELTAADFSRSSVGCFLKEAGRRTFWEAWFRRLDTEVTHPQFGYAMSYRRMMEVQARQLWRFVRGEAERYFGFTTR
jgi:CRISP-associated protein Cas1